MLKKSYIVFLCLSITGCGFHLQGADSSFPSFPSQFQDVYVDSSRAPHSAIAPSLDVALEDNKIHCIEAASGAKYFLNILNDSRSSRQIGSGTSQETRKYSLIATVSFNVTDKSGRTVYGPTTITSSIIHYVYSGQVFGNNQEEETLYRELNDNVVQQILFKLSSAEFKHELTRK